MIVSYIDPGTGSMLISAVIALFSVAFFMLKGFIYRKFSLGGDKGETLDPSKKYGLVFYSEGKQYWNVFKPVLEESSKRSVKATYLTSDKEDPGLTTNLEGIDAIFIGSGREAFFVLNRLNADMVVMTTPGLDVLEIKRSKNVKHYAHLTHATSSVATYKAYATDYYDSVLIGGEGDEGVIRELESKRNLEPKDIEIVGLTYLDVLRSKISEFEDDYTFFKEKKTTILVSPTWGNHGLLTICGDLLLSELEKSGKYNVIVRPHPQSFISEQERMKDLMTKFPDNENRVWNRDVENLEAMAHADIMISDFSGIIYDFFTLFKKPILTMNALLEKRGRDAIDLAEDSWDFQLLNVIGRTLSEDDIKNISNIVDATLKNGSTESKVGAQALLNLDKYPGEAGVRTMNFIEDKLEILHQNQTETSDACHSDTYDYESQSYTVTGGLFAKLMKILIKPNMLFQIMLATGLLGSFMYLGTLVLPEEGLNQLFLIKILPYTAMTSLIILGVIILIIRVKGKGQFVFRKNSEKIQLVDFLFIGLPMTPIIQYIIANQDILSFKSSVLVFVFFMIVAIVGIILIPWLLSPIITKNLTISVGMSFLFIIFNMASFGKLTKPSVIALILAGLCILIFAILFFNKRTILITVSLVFFITNAGVSLFTEDPEAIDREIISTNTESLFYEHTKNLTAQNKADVFLLIYDAYSNQETMDSYGFDNSEQTDFLLDNGFTIYDGTYSIGADSLSSMAHVLNPELIGGGLTGYREKVSGEASGLGVFARNEYVTNSVFDSDYLTRDFTPKYNFSFPGDKFSIDAHKVIIDAILEGEFRFDAEFSTIEYQDYLDAKEYVLKQNLKAPEFLYSHGSFPGHSQNSGVLLPNETELHIEGIEKANKEMRNDIETIRSQNPDAIIIVAGDHGPYLTKNGIGLYDYDISEVDRIDVQDRFGTFLAISWPDSSYETRYDIKILQDIMPAITAYIYNDDSLFDKTRMDRDVISPGVIGGVNIVDGVVVGGQDDGKPLFQHNTPRQPHSDQ